VIARSEALLAAMVRSMRATGTTELQFFLQQHAPAILATLDRAQALRRDL
jgi:hypothetical protein